MILRKKLAVSLCFALAGAACSTAVAQQQEKAATRRTLVRAGHLLDVKTGKTADAQTIVVVGDTIQSIAPTASVAAQPGDTVVDLGGMTVMPGLIDVHTHLTMNPDFDPYRELTSTDCQRGHQRRGECAHHADGRFHDGAQRGRQRLCGCGPARRHQCGTGCRDRTCR